MKGAKKAYRTKGTKLKEKNTHVIGIPGGENESIFKAIMAENFQNLRKEMDTQIHEA